MGGERRNGRGGEEKRGREVGRGGARERREKREERGREGMEEKKGQVCEQEGMRCTIVQSCQCQQHRLQSYLIHNLGIFAVGHIG